MAHDARHWYENTSTTMIARSNPLCSCQAYRRDNRYVSFSKPVAHPV